jgi:hypothetical protein
MMIGQNVSIFSVHDDAGTGARDLPWSTFEIGQPEETPEHLVAIRRLRANGLADADIDDRRCDLLDQRRQARQRLTVDTVGQCS